MSEDEVKPWMWAIAGLSTLAFFSVAGWIAYSRFAVSPPRIISSPSNGAIAPEPSPTLTTAERSPSSSPSSLMNALIDDPFAEAVRIAQDAAEAGTRASTSENWYALAVQWKQASELMASVPSSDPRYDIAQDRAEQYLENSEYALQQSRRLSSIESAHIQSAYLKSAHQLD